MTVRDERKTTAIIRQKPQERQWHLWALIGLFLCFSYAPFTSYAQEPDRYTAVEVTPQKNKIHAGETFTIATTIKMEPHWHVYWLNPGDSGLPVIIEWDAPEGFEFSDIKWPVPDKISYEILANYGYYDTVTLLQDVTVPTDFDEKKTSLSARIDMLVCNDICIPESSDAELTFNDPLLGDIDNTALIETINRNLPATVNGAFTFEETQKNSEKHLRLNLDISSLPENINKDRDLLEFFPHNLGIISHIAEPEIVEKGNDLIITHKRGDQPLPDTLSGLLVIKSETKGENKGYEIKLTHKTGEAAGRENPETAQSILIADTQNTAKEDVTWIGAIILAFLGGMVLNLMPCVFPVLSIKALKLIKIDPKKENEAKKQAWAYAAGVVISFMIVGGILIALRSAGNAIGWGFQLQNPVIIAILAYLLFTIGLNLIGFFEFSSRLTNVGGKLTNPESTRGSFFTGVLATIVATPCTAPFMATAIGFAITQNAIISMSIFMSLGMGMAFPFLILSLNPKLRSAMPKPGPWMETFKQFLAFPMFASAIWLIWVLNNQTGATGLLTVLLGMLSITFAVWLAHLARKTENPNKAIMAATIIFVLLPFVNLPFFQTIPKTLNTESAKAQEKFYKPFSEETLAQALATDKPVFVELTADWCITCKFNHAVAINVDSTKQLMKEKNIIFLQGDWTNKNAEISEYLLKFKRNGVPLYVYYPAPDAVTQKRPPPKLLPQILTTTTLQNTLKEK